LKDWITAAISAVALAVAAALAAIWYIALVVTIFVGGSLWIVAMTPLAAVRAIVGRFPRRTASEVGMAPARKHLEAIRLLLARHADSGQVPAAEVRVFLAEIEAALDAPASELKSMGERVDIDRNIFGFPHGLSGQKGSS
jgi:hypothetical protein